MQRRVWAGVVGRVSMMELVLELGVNREKIWAVASRKLNGRVANGRESGQTSELLNARQAGRHFDLTLRPGRDA